MSGIDWEEIKKIICGVVKDLEKVCKDLPDGGIKNIICGIISVLELICEKLP